SAASCVDVPAAAVSPSVFQTGRKGRPGCTPEGSRCRAGRNRRHTSPSETAIFSKRKSMFPEIAVPALDRLAVLFLPCPLLLLAHGIGDAGFRRAGDVDRQRLGFGEEVGVDGEVGGLADRGRFVAHHEILFLRIHYAQKNGDCQPSISSRSISSSSHSSSMAASFSRCASSSAAALAKPAGSRV